MTKAEILEILVDNFSIDKEELKTMAQKT